jgi:hypothetical protein
LIILDILNTFIHPDYNGDTVYYDVAVLETKPLNFSGAIQPVCLPGYDDKLVKLYYYEDSMTK